MAFAPYWSQLDTFGHRIHFDCTHICNKAAPELAQKSERDYLCKDFLLYEYDTGTEFEDFTAGCL